MIIGLSGLIGAGKDTVADVLVQRHGFVKIAMADTLKDAVAAMFGWPRYLLQGNTQESREYREIPDPFWSERLGKTITPRYMLQQFGTEVMRNSVHNDIWVFTMERNFTNYKNIVIPDIRFPNEIQSVRKAGGHLVKLIRGELPVWTSVAEEGNHERMKTEFPHVHPSEWMWMNSEYDYTIENNRDLVHLGYVTEMVLRNLTGYDTPLTSDR